VGAGTAAHLEIRQRDAVRRVVGLAEEQVPQALRPTPAQRRCDAYANTRAHRAFTFRSSTTGRTVFQRWTGSSGSCAAATRRAGSASSCARSAGAGACTAARVAPARTRSPLRARPSRTARSGPRPGRSSTPRARALCSAHHGPCRGRRELGDRMRGHDGAGRGRGRGR
jgi:hypothetical protein